MSKSANDMTHINYNAVKDRMLETSKGFWKVKSIHTLTTRLQSRYNPRDFILLKTIKKPPPKLPSFISLEHEIYRKNRQLEHQKNFSAVNLNVGNFFITGNEKRINKQKKKEEIKNIFDKLFGSFTYEPFLYNDCQFFYLQREPRLLPRKFNDVIKDCLAFREYQNYINNIKNTKDENITTENNNNFNGRKNLSYMGKNQNYLNIFNNVINNKNKNMSKNASIIRQKIVKRKCFSSSNIRDGKNRRAILLKSDTGKSELVKKFPTLRIKSVYKSKEREKLV